MVKVKVFKDGTFKELLMAYSQDRMSRDKAYRDEVLANVGQRKVTVQAA